MTKLKAMTRKQLTVIIALFAALCVLIPSIAIGLSANAEPMMKAASVAKKETDEIVTNKTATPNEDGTYHVQIEAYANDQEVLTIPTDTVLVLERSSKMSEVLYTREHTNLKTYTVFEANRLRAHNDMFDVDNPSNYQGFTIQFSNTYKNNKYVLDPNTPDTYLYLCQTFDHTIGNNYYTYSIVDTQGNVYESQRYHTSVVSSIFTINELSLTWKSNINYPNITSYNDYVSQTGLTSTKETYTLNYLYTRDDDNATNATLWNQYKNNGGLWIEDDYDVLCPVTITRYGRDGNVLADSASNSDAAYYVYQTTDSTGKDFTVTYGNPVYGGQYSVFQGFKSYDSTGVVDHKNSIEHKTLYNGQSQNVTKLLAMQEATEDFILTVHKNAYDNELTEGQQKVGVVSYASKTDWFNPSALSKIEYPLTDVYSESDAYKMIKTVYAMEANGRRRIDVGMDYAGDVLNSGSSSDHKVNVVAFTTGMPSTDVNGSFETSIANNAISEARAIEQAYPLANIYTIGLYDLADSSQTYGNWFYRMSHSNIPCDGTVGSYWGGTALSSWTNYDMDPNDAAATNRFLNYMSSNYRTASNIGLSYGWIRPSFWSTGGNGYTITQNYDRSDDGFYYSATDTDSMKDAFDSIASNIEVPLSTLDTDTKLVDHVSDYFNIVGDVNAYTMNYNGAGDTEDASSWSKGSAMNATVSNNGKTVSVTDFDYSNNYCAPGHAGQKVVIEFDVEPIDNFLGGHDVPTNLGSSALEDKNGTTVETLPYPEVDVDLVKDLTVHDQYIYYTNEADLEKLFDVSPYAQGLTNDFANLKYELIDPDAEEGAEPVFVYTVDAGKDVGESSLEGENKANQYPVLEENKTYQVKITVSTNDDVAADRESVEDTKDATVYVYKPTLTVKDTEKEYQDAVAGVDLNENRVSVEWKAEGTDQAAPSENVPTLEYEFFDLTNDPKTAVTDPTSHSMTETTDYNVEVTIKGHDFYYQTELPYYVKADGTTVLVSEYTGDKSDLVPVTYIEVDEEGNETTVTQTDDEGNVVYQQTSQLTTVQANQPDAKDADKHFTTYVNESDNNKTNGGTEGNFTVSTGKPYDLVLSKIFSGPYAQPEGLVFTITGSDGSSQTIEFAESDFEGQKSGEKTAATKLRTGVTYTLVEGFADEDTDPVRYDTTATKQMDAGEVQVLADMDETDEIANFQFTIDGESNPEKLTIVVTNTDTQEIPPATGFTTRESNHNLLLAALAILVVLGGGASLYKVWKKEETE